MRLSNDDDRENIDAESIDAENIDAINIDACNASLRENLMWVIVAYDVSTETKAGRKRLRRVAQVCKDYGQRVQKSVFECQVNEMKFEELRRRLLTEINENEDNLRLYRLTEPREFHVEEYGLASTIFFEEPLII